MKKEITLILLCTLIMSIGQYFLKIGANNLTITNIITNYSLIIGIILYAFAAYLLIIALKTGELSTVYPILATTYIWVNLIALFLLNETLGTLNWVGTLFIIGGIILISRK